MATDPLTASYLATAPEAPTVNDLQKQRLTLRQLASQNAIQKQIQAENAFKLKAQAEDQQDDEIFRTAYQKNLLANAPKTYAAAAAQSAGGLAEDQESGTAGDTASAPVASTQTTPPDIFGQSVMAKTLQEVQGKLRPRNTLKYSQALQDQSRAFQALTKDQQEQHQENNKELGRMAYAAWMSDDPKQQDAIWETLLRRAPTMGVDVSGAPPALPADPKARKNILESTVTHLGLESDITQHAQRMSQEQQRLEGVQRQKDADARAQADADRKAAVRQLMTAQDGADYNAKLAKIKEKNPDLALNFPQSIPVGPLEDDFKDQVRYVGMEQKDVDADIARKERQADLRQAAADRKQEAADKLAAGRAPSPISVALDWAKSAYPNAPPAVQYDRALSRLSETTKEGKIDTGSIDKVAARAALTGFDKAKTKEAQLTSGLDALSGEIDRAQAAVGSGNFGTANYVTPVIESDGRVRLQSVPLSMHLSKNSGVTAQAALDEMKAKANSLRDNIMDAVKDKADHAGRIGLGDSVDVKAAKDAMEGGKYQIGQPKPAAKTSSSTPTPKGKDGKEITIGSIVTGPDGKPRVVTGLANGKVQTRPQ